jgi:hypothetical protein
MAPTVSFVSAMEASVAGIRIVTCAIGNVARYRNGSGVEPRNARLVGDDHSAHAQEPDSQRSMPK